jgi:hypothetical protein
MIGLQRVLHAQQKPQSQNSEHVPSARLTTVMTSAAGLVRAKFMATRCIA